MKILLKLVATLAVLTASLAFSEDFDWDQFEEEPLTLEYLDKLLRKQEQEILLLKQTVDSLIEKNHEIVSGHVKDWIILNLRNNNSKFTRTMTLTDFYITIQHVESYLDGYKVILHIGNPHNASYSDGKIYLRWFCNGESYTRELPILRRLESGSWTKCEIFIDPCKLDSFIMLKLEIDMMTLLPAK